MEATFGGLVVAVVLFLAVVPMVVVWVWALIDAIKVPDDSMYRAGDKLVWVIVIVLLQIIGAIIYIVVGRPRRASS